MIEVDFGGICKCRVRGREQIVGKIINILNISINALLPFTESWSGKVFIVDRRLNSIGSFGALVV